ncbi:melatonin receptor type 1B-like [Bolinopsis microptera]|uniref:melatonin receptor type 1B-like n=1 Tax=Bolinopsis microptera TaxID=2820187 RepID=UPI00307A76CE
MADTIPELADTVPELADTVTVPGIIDSNWTGSYPTPNYTSIVMMHYTVKQLTVLKVATLLLSVLGLIGNLLVVLVILSRRRWRFANSMFVLNIAIANLFICAFTLPLMTRALFEIE